MKDHLPSTCKEDILSSHFELGSLGMAHSRTKHRESRPRLRDFTHALSDRASKDSKPLLGTWNRVDKFKGPT